MSKQIQLQENRSKLRVVLTNLLSNIDVDTLDYFETMILDSSANNIEFDREVLKEMLAPFIESYGIADDLEGAMKICDSLYTEFVNMGVIDASDGNSNQHASDNGVKLLDKSVTLSDLTNILSESEKSAVENMWGFESIRKKRNEIMEVNEAGSAKYERKAANEQKKWLKDLDSKFHAEGGDGDDGDSDDENNQISAMTLPDLSGNNREKDIQVNNVTITYGGRILLDNADLRLVFGRRYGLIGRNGIGKTTLLKHMANFDIEGFPRHHRVLHVKQEVKSSTLSVLEVVLSADVERSTLLKRELELVEKQRHCSDSNTAELQAIMDEMSELNERIQLIGVHSAESRAASILSGLQFSEAMQHSSTDSLSGGWRMRVALAGALLVEPDLLMLDEPTNHLDLEAVLWLEEYLKNYPKTVLLVSHDKAFLNEVCTDIVLFTNLKLNYYKGNYDSFESTFREMRVVQQKQHEAQQVKIQHMQEFVDKFRYNAKRASLVQSRIKTIERETVVDAVEEEVSFSFSFFDSGQLGRPIIQIEGVTFGYDYSLAPSNTKPALFYDVHLNVDQSSRVALVGPNGCGKSTLVNLLQGKMEPQVGIIRINPQLRIGIFTQHHMDSFDLSLSPLQNMGKRWPLVNEADFRSHLGKFEITGNDALKPMKMHSGGQKSRVAFACLTYSKPHVVILDEPTNHLDMGAIEALANALKAFHGGILIISHDQHFITSVCNEIWLIQDRKVKVFDGAFTDYKKSVVTRIRQSSNLHSRRK